MEPRVSSNLASFSGPASNLRVAPQLRSPVPPSDAAASCPALRIFRPFRLAAFRVSSNHAPFGIASGESPGRPAASLLWRASQWISGLPRISHPPTLPAMRLRVAPNSASSGVPAMNPRVAPVVSSSCAAPGESPGCPEFPLPLQRRRRIFGFPRISRPSGCTVPASPGFPDSCSYGWADDDSPNLLELCILGRAADESSCPIGSCTFPPDPGCLLNISSVFHRRQADSELPSSIKSCIVLPGWNCVSNSLQGHQLRRRVGLFNLWKQVQKMESPVDITKVGA